MTDSLRTYFCSRQAYKAFLRRQKASRNDLSCYFTDNRAYRRFIRVYEPLRRETSFKGIQLVIEVAKGESQPANSNEKRKSPAVNNYGSIQNTVDKDGESLDVFLGDNPDSDAVAIIDQVKADGSFDEHKILLGFQLASAEDARSTYLACYEDGWYGFGGAVLLGIEDFKAWLQTYNPTRPVTDLPAKKALAEASGTTGGYVSDWTNIRCPSCGGRMTCECQGKEKAHERIHDRILGGVATGGNGDGDPAGAPRHSQGTKEVAPTGASFPPPAYWQTDRISFAGDLQGTA